jgi:hypothetical protein
MTYSPCSSGEVICCKDTGGYYCAAAGRGCPNFKAKVNDEKDCKGGTNYCHCAKCDNEGECNMMCGHTNYVCKYNQCRKELDDDCSIPEGDTQYQRYTEPKELL